MSGFEIPAVAWNDRLTGIQVAATVAKKRLVRVDSLPACVDKEALRDEMQTFDLTWVSLALLKKCLATMCLRMKLSPTDAESVLNKTQDTLNRFDKVLPPARLLLNERKVLEKADQKRFDSFEIKADLRKMEEAGHVFYNILALPVEKKYDVRVALKRAESERKLVKEANNEAALRRRAALLPELIDKHTKAVGVFQRRAGRYARLVTKTQARLLELQGEAAVIADKLRVLGTVN